MRYAYKEATTACIFMNFTEGDSVTIEVYNHAGVKQTLTDSSAKAISGTDMFMFRLDNIQGLSLTHGDYLVIASNGTYTQEFQAGVGGYAEL